MFPPFITPYPRPSGTLVASDNNGPRGAARELRLHETRPGIWQAFRWHDHGDLGWRGALEYGLTAIEWKACGWILHRLTDPATETATTQPEGGAAA